jgi:ketosteroid isomerase-like protein
MSQENVELVRRVYSLRADAAGIARGDYDDVFRDYFDPEYEIVPPFAYPDAESSYRGREALRHWFRQMDEIWSDFRVEPERFFDAGAQVVVFVRVTGTAKRSGAAPGTSAAHVQTLRDGRITRTDIFLDRAEALEAAGLRE